MGRYHCPNCGRRRPEPAVVAERVVLRGMDGTDVTMRLPDGERFDALVPAPRSLQRLQRARRSGRGAALGVASSDIQESLSKAAAVFGRVERLRVNDRDVAILLVKNPAGANEVLRTLRLEDGEIDLWVALNDRIADGRDVSWVWDADFELLAPRIRRVTCAGTRAEEMALRLKYAGVDTAAIAVEREAGLGGSLDKAIADRGSNGAPLFALPTYTALIELRDDLSDRGVAGKWSD